MEILKTRTTRPGSIAFAPLHRAGVDFIPVVGRRGRLLGAYVVDNHGARWEPAFNLNSAIFWGNASFLAMLAVGGLIMWRRSRTRRAATAGDNAKGDRAQEDRTLRVAAG